MTLYTGMPIQRGPFYLEDYQSSLGASIDATAEAASVTNPIESIMRMRELSRAERGVGNDILDYNPFGAQPPDTASPMTDAGTARQRIKDEGLNLTVPDAGIRSRALDILIERKNAERQREDILNRAPTGIGASSARFATNLAVSAMDPLNIASGFIPVIGEARYAGMLAGAGGVFGRAAVRAGVGAAEGAVGAAAVEPLVYGAAQQEQADYSLTDSLSNIAVGTVLGGGLHVGAGAVGDAVRAGRDWRTAKAAPDAPIPRMMEAAPPDVREAAIRTGVSQAVDGRELNIEPLFQLPGTMERLSEIQLGDVRKQSLASFGESEARISELTAQAAQFPQREAEVGALSQSVDTLRGEAESLRVDLSNAQQRQAAIEPVLNEATQARLDAIASDLQTPALPKSRRDALQHEQSTILESVRNAHPDSEDAARQRASVGQEIQGLQKALTKKEGNLAKAQTKLDTASHKTTSEKNATSIALNNERQRLQSKQEDATRYLGRSVARLAKSGYNLTLPRQEAEVLARSILAEKNDVAAPVRVRSVTDALKKRSIALHGAQPPAAVVPSAEGLSAGPPQNLQDTARASFAPEQMRLYDGEAVRIADERVASTPSDEAIPDATLQEVMDDVTRLADSLFPEEKVPEPAPGDQKQKAAAGSDKAEPKSSGNSMVDRELADVNELQDTAAAYGRGILAAALCRLRRA